MKVNPYIFREYDIRGVVADDFSPEFAHSLGQGFGTFVKRGGGQEISLSGDIRLTTPMLKENFKSGVLETGVDVIDIGILPTPVNYYSMFKLSVAGAAQITGSHNPPEMNGFKLSFQKGAVYGEMIQQIRKLMEDDDFETGEGTEVAYNLLPEYLSMVLGKINFDRPMKIAMDCGNAAACLAAPKIFRELGADLTEIFCDVDGTFPNHHPDPTVPENLTELIKTVQDDNFDCGIAYDGDADRVGVIDENGQVIWADMIMALILPEIVEPGDEVLFDVKCSQALEEEIVRLGGKPVIWKTGHSLIKQKMKELGCRFGGEMSGHLFFADDYFGYDDAIYVSARIVQMLSRQNKTISELVANLPQYVSTPEMRLDCPDDEAKFKLAEAAVEYFSANFNCLDVDGVRIRFDDGWGLVRASNTQPVIVVRFEAKTQERMEEIKGTVLSKLQELGEFTMPEDD